MEWGKRVHIRQYNSTNIWNKTLHFYQENPFPRTEGWHLYESGRRSFPEVCVVSFLTTRCDIIIHAYREWFLTWMKMSNVLMGIHGTRQTQWRKSGMLIGEFRSTRRAIYLVNTTVYYQPTSSRCSCRKGYDGQSDLLFNLDNKRFFYYRPLFQYMIEGRNPLIAYQRYGVMHPVYSISYIYYAYMMYLVFRCLTCTYHSLQPHSNTISIFQ